MIEDSNVSTIVGGDPKALHSLLIPKGMGGPNSTPKRFQNLTLRTCFFYDGNFLVNLTFFSIKFIKMSQGFQIISY